MYLKSNWKRRLLPALRTRSSDQREKWLYVSRMQISFSFSGRRVQALPPEKKKNKNPSVLAADKEGAERGTPKSYL